MKTTVTTHEDGDGWFTFKFSDGKQMRCGRVTDPERLRLVMESIVNLPEYEQTFLMTLTQRYKID